MNHINHRKCPTGVVNEVWKLSRKELLFNYKPSRTEDKNPAFPRNEAQVNLSAQVYFNHMLTKPKLEAHKFSSLLQRVVCSD